MKRFLISLVVSLVASLAWCSTTAAWPLDLESIDSVALPVDSVSLRLDSVAVEMDSVVGKKH